MSEAPERPSNADLAKTSALTEATALVRKPAATLAELGKLFVEVFGGTDKTPAVAPQPKITEEQHKALKRLVEVFGKVAPTESRELTPAEVRDLITERLVLDQVNALVDTRKGGIRTTVYHHFDRRAEREGRVVTEDVWEEKDGHWVRTAEATQKDKDGFYILADKSGGQGESQQFSREPREGSGTLTLAALQQLELDGVITHKEYLAVTEPVRVVDNHAVMSLLGRRPDLIEPVGRAMTFTSKSAALNMRKP